jgi:Arc/MetJ-type ribon-helix-helix transcriptional regulator
MSNTEQSLERITISMPSSMVRQIQAEMERGHYASISEWVRDAVRSRLSSGRVQLAGPSQEEEARRLEAIERGEYSKGDVMEEIRKAAPQRPKSA